MRFTYYNILEIQDDANLETIEKNYKKQSLIWHFDKCHDWAPAELYGDCEEISKVIVAAGETLRTPTSKAAYDFKLKFPCGLAEEKADALLKQKYLRLKQIYKDYAARQTDPEACIRYLQTQLTNTKEALSKTTSMVEKTEKDFQASLTILGNSQTAKLKSLETANQSLAQQLETKDEAIKKLKAQLDAIQASATKQLQEKDTELNKLRATNISLTNTLAAKEKELASIQSQKQRSLIAMPQSNVTANTGIENFLPIHSSSASTVSTQASNDNNRFFQKNNLIVPHGLIKICKIMYDKLGAPTQFEFGGVQLIFESKEKFLQCRQKYYDTVSNNKGTFNMHYGSRKTENGVPIVNLVFMINSKPYFESGESKDKNIDGELLLREFKKVVNCENIPEEFTTYDLDPFPEKYLPEEYRQERMFDLTSSPP